MQQLTYLTMAQAWECDQMGHWNVRFYGAAFDDASFQLVGHLAGATPPAGLGWADVRTEIDYRDETRAGTLLRISTELVRIGRSSLTYRHLMTETLTGKLKAEALTTSVRFDLTQRKAVPIEAEARARAELLLAA